MVWRSIVLLLLICCNMPIFIKYVNSIIEKIVQGCQRFSLLSSPRLKMIAICQDYLVLSIV